MRREWRKGPWAPEEDEKLKEHVKLLCYGRWSSVARLSGLKRNNKSCRLRWVNYLRSGLKRAPFTLLEEGVIIELNAMWGNKWSTIARYLPGRTDNETKNYWRTHFKKESKPYRNCKHKKTLKAPGSNYIFIEQNKQDQFRPYERKRGTGIRMMKKVVVRVALKINAFLWYCRTRKFLIGRRTLLLETTTYCCGVADYIISMMP